MSHQLLKKLFVVYKNVHNLLRDRKYTIEQKFKNIEDFSKKFERSPIFLMDSNRSILIHISKETTQLKKKGYAHIMKSIKIPKSISEFMIVALTPIKPKMLAYVTDDTNNKKYSIYYIYYLQLMLNLPKHILIPKHTLLSIIETNNLYKNSSYKKGDLPNIFETDPISMWYGARKGQVFKIERVDSNTTLGKNEGHTHIINPKDITYREVIEHPKLKLYA